MIRPVTLTSFVLALGLGFALFKVKYEVQSLEGKMVHVERQMDLDAGAIHVYKATWSMETRPQALAMLVSRHLDLKPMTAAEIGNYDTLPLNEAGIRPDADVKPAIPDIIAQNAPAGVQVASTAAPRFRNSSHNTVMQLASLPARVDSSGDASIDAVLQAMRSSGVR